MAKISLSNIRVVDVENNKEFSYQATTTPKAGTLGNSYFGTLSSRGIAKLQQAGFSVNNEKEWCDLLRATFKLNEEELGTRGEKWSSPEERTAHKVYINDIEFNPEFTPGQLKRIQVTQVEEQKTEESIETPAVAVADITPVIPQAPTPQMPTPAIQAPQVTTKDNTSAVDLAHIEKLKSFIATGKYSKAILISSLAKQTNKEKAEELYKLAVTEAIPLF